MKKEANYSSELKYFLYRYVILAWKWRKRTGYFRMVLDFFYELVFKIKYPKFKYLLKLYQDSFDETSLDNILNSNQYEANSAYVISDAFKQIRKLIKPHNTTFIDIGSGAGRIIFEAYRHNYKKSIGLELSRELLEICDKNLSEYVSCKNKDSIITAKCDVTKVNFSDFINEKEGNIILYLFNPFNDITLEQFIKNYLAQVTFPTYIIYVNKQYPDVLKAYGFNIIFERRINNKFTLDSFRIYKN